MTDIPKCSCPDCLAREKNEVTTWEGFNQVDLDRARGVLRDLQNDVIHDAPCSCPSCKYQLHRRSGGRFDKEIFFLYWLELEVKLSLIVQREYTVFSRTPGKLRDKEHTSVAWKDFKRSRGTIQGLANYIGEHFPEIDSDAGRIKLRLWRFKKSGVDKALDEDINDQRLKALGPTDDRWRTVRLGQRIADYIYSLPDRMATQRELRRRFQGPVDELEELRPWLLLNYGIECRRGGRKNLWIYHGRLASSRGRFLHVGVDASKQGVD